MRSYKKLLLLCCLVYFVSYVTRINYAAALTEIIADLNVSKQIASIAVTGSFITYGIGQVLSGIIGDKFKPTHVIFVGIIGTSLINLSMVFIPDITVINAVWCANGFFQALLWPPLVRIITEHIPSEKYTVSVLRVSQSAYAATMVMYAIVPVIITVASWRFVFLFSAAVGLAFAALWYFGTKNMTFAAPSVKNEQSKAPRLGFGLLLSVGFVPVFLAIILQGMLRDGLSTWMPTYVADVFKLGSSVSILTGVIIPVFNIFGIGIMSKIGEKIGNELKSSAVFYAVAFVCNILLTVFFSKFAVLDIASMAIINTCMHGINIMLICDVPRYFAKYGKVSTVSGLFNCATYIGAALSTYVFAFISDKYGWNTTVIFWAGISLIGIIICAATVKTWSRFRNSN